MSGLSKIRVALIGVGNCASAIVQGLQYYGDHKKAEECLGLRNLELGGYYPRDVEIVEAFDVDAHKVGKDLSEAIFTPPNNAPKPRPKAGFAMPSESRTGPDLSIRTAVSILLAFGARPFLLRRLAAA